MAENARTAESPFGFFRGVYCGESSPKFKMYNEQKTDGVLTRENQNYNNKSVEIKKHKNITGLKFRSTVTEKRKLRKVMRKRGKVPLYPYFHP